MAEPVLNTDQCPFVVLQIQNDGTVFQRTGLGDQVQVFVNQSGIALRNDVRLDLAEGIEEPARRFPTEVNTSNTTGQRGRAEPCRRH